jgi:hypothetical protein
MVFSPPYVFVTVVIGAVADHAKANKQARK